MYIAALDIGGTKTIAGIVSENGKVLTQEKFPTDIADYNDHLKLCCQHISQVISRLGLRKEDICGLGVSLPGVVDINKGLLLYAPYAKWENIAVANYLQTGLDISKVRCENDVNACAVGELRFGLGKKYTDFIWMTVSTGVGGAVVINSRLVRGTHGYAGEFGHLKVEYADPAICPCGQKGCLEAQGSGTALIRKTKERSEKSISFAKALELHGLKPDGAGCATLAKEGNAEAMEIMNEIGRYLGRGISYCLNILDTQAVIIGGGVAASLDLLMPAIRSAIQKDAFNRIQTIDIVKTPLGYEAALLGAAALVLE